MNIAIETQDTQNIHYQKYFMIGKYHCNTVLPCKNITYFYYVCANMLAMQSI